MNEAQSSSSTVFSVFAFLLFMVFGAFSVIFYKLSHLVETKTDERERAGQYEQERGGDEAADD